MSRHRITSASCPFFPSKQTFVSASEHVRYVPEADIRGPTRSIASLRDFRSQHLRTSHSGGSTPAAYIFGRTPSKWQMA